MTFAKSIPMSLELHPRSNWNYILDGVRSTSSMVSELHPRSSRSYIKDENSTKSNQNLIAIRLKSDCIPIPARIPTKKENKKYD